MRCMQIRRFARIGAIAALACLSGAARARSDDARDVDRDGDRSQRAVVPGAVVNATNIATNISTTTKTNQEGTYTFTALPPASTRWPWSLPASSATS